MFTIKIPEINNLFELIVFTGASIIPGITLFLLFPELKPNTTSDLLFIIYSIAFSLPFLLTGIITRFVYGNKKIPALVFIVGSISTFYTIIIIDYIASFLLGSFGIYYERIVAIYALCVPAAFIALGYGGRPAKKSKKKVPSK